MAQQMLVIRNEQMAIFRKSALDEFERDMQGSIAERCPQQFQTLGERGVLELIRAGIAKALGYGLNQSGDVSALIDVMLDHGADFDKLPEFQWAGTVLTDARLTGDTRVALLKERITLQTGR